MDNHIRQMEGQYGSHNLCDSSEVHKTTGDEQPRTLLKQ